MFENQTYEVILNRMLARLPDDIDKRQGSVVYDMLAPKAAELAQAYINLDVTLDLGFPDTTTGELLERKVAEQGLERKEAVKAEGSVTFSGNDGQVVALGTRVSTDEVEPVYFVTTEEVTISGGTADATIEAEEGGSDGNVSANSITLVLGNLSGIVTVTNPEELSGGIDEETDEELYERYNEKVSRPTTSGNKYNYEQWAKEVQGISDARVYPLWNGAGTLKVVVVNSEKREPSSDVLTEVTDYIEERRPIGADVTVSGVNEVYIDISVTVTAVSGSDISAIKDEVSTNISDYLTEIAFDQTIVRYTQIGNAILNVSDVIDYSNLTVNGQSANIQLNDDEVPVIGTVDVQSA